MSFPRLINYNPDKAVGTGNGNVLYDRVGDLYWMYFFFLHLNLENMVEFIFFTFLKESVIA